MKLIQSWAESLTLLKPENFKLFLLVTLKSIIETYKVLFTKFWVIIIFSLGMDIGAYHILMRTQELQILPSMQIALWFTVFFGATLALMGLCMTIFLSARASVGLKNWSYLLSYWRHFIYFLFAWFVAMICKSFLLILLIYWILFVAFMLDTNGYLKPVGVSFWRSLKMMAYNFPFIVITTALFSLLFFPIEKLLFNHDASLSLWEFIVRFCVVNLIQLPVLVCFFINFYIKRKHEQFNLYFPVKGE